MSYSLGQIFFFAIGTEHKINSLSFFMHMASSINQPSFFFKNFVLLVRVQYYLVGGKTLCIFAGNIFTYFIGLFLVEKNKKNCAYFSKEKHCIAECGQNKCKCISSLIETWGIWMVSCLLGYLTSLFITFI